MRGLLLSGMLVAACSGDEAQGPRGPKRVLPAAEAPADRPPAPRDDAKVEARAPEDVRAPAAEGAVDCPAGTESRGAAPPVALESYCLRRTDAGAVRHGPYRQWFSDGTVRAEGTFSDGERDGSFTEYHEDGFPKAVTTFSRGVRDGKWRTFHPGGALEAEGTYDDGKKSGLATFYWPEGTKKAEGTWRDDVKVGESTNWYPDGTLQSSGAYVAGNKHGEWIDVDAAGVEVKSTWQDGVRVAP